MFFVACLAYNIAARMNPNNVITISGQDSKTNQAVWVGGMALITSVIHGTSHCRLLLKQQLTLSVLGYELHKSCHMSIAYHYWTTDLLLYSRE